VTLPVWSWVPPGTAYGAQDGGEPPHVSTQGTGVTFAATSDGSSSENVSWAVSRRNVATGDVTDWTSGGPISIPAVAGSGVSIDGIDVEAGYEIAEWQLYDTDTNEILLDWTYEPTLAVEFNATGLAPAAGLLDVTSFTASLSVSWTDTAPTDASVYVHWDDVNSSATNVSPGVSIDNVAGTADSAVITVSFVVESPNVASTYRVWAEVVDTSAVVYDTTDLGDVGVTVLAFDVPAQVGKSVRVAVYGEDATTFIANVPRRRNVKWLDEVNTAGTGSFDVHLDDQILVDHPDLLDENNVVRCWVGANLVKAFRIEDLSPVRLSSGEAADRWVTVSGRGPLADMDYAIVYPEYGLRPGVSEDRYFNFASVDGPWRVASEWTTPVGVAWTGMTGVRAGYPKGWPDASAQWLWSTSPLANAPAGVNWFRSTFALAANSNVIVYATADDAVTVYIDGEIVITSASWKHLGQWSMTLPAGPHTIAAEAKNNNLTSGGPSAAGFVATIVRADANGDATSDVVWRSTTVNTLVKAYGETPGWTGAAVMQQLVVEAQQRGVTNLLPVTFDFTPVVDSDGVPWDDIQARSVKVGTTDLSDLIQQLIEVGMDVDLDANFTLHAWKKRGTDRSTSVILRPNNDLTGAAGTVKIARIRNQALLKYDGGWMEMYSSSSRDAHGRREIGLSIGTAADTSQTQLVGEAALREVADPEKTIPVSYTSLKGPQPRVDFDLGDTILVPDVYEGMVGGRLMSIAGSELGEGSAVQWDLDFYPDVPDDTIDTTVVSGALAVHDPSTLYQDEVMSDSPWGFWRLKESTGTTFADTSGRKHTLTMYWPGKPATTHKPTLSLPGPVDQAVQFDTNTSGSGVVPFDMAMAKTNLASGALYKYQPVTFECWLKRISTPGSTASVMLLYAAGTTTVAAALAITSAGHVTLQYYDTHGVFHGLTSTGAIPTTKFTHVVVSYGARGGRLYLNGKLNRSSAVAGVLRHVGYQFVLRGDVDGDATNAIIAEPAVYFQQLLDSRIASHFAASEYTS
jgi:hypothetical protein